jgi:hypothetical protein
MIHINFVRQTPSAPSSKGLKKAAPYVIVVLACVLVAVTGVLVYRYVPFSRIVRQAATRWTSRTADTDTDTVTTSRTYAPSSQRGSRAVEDVVRDVRSDGQPVHDTGLLALSYDEMSFHERVCYEHLFARKTLAFVSEMTPDNVIMKRLSLQDFTSLHGEGYTPQRSAVRTMFHSLRSSDRFTLHKPPRSYIRAADGSGYAYAYEATVQWGLDIDEPGVDLSLPQCIYKGNEEIITDRLAVLAKDNDVSYLQGPDLLSTKRHGAFFRNTYRFSAITSFPDIARYVRAASEKPWYCGFSRLVVTARDNDRVHVDARLVITLRK